MDNPKAQINALLQLINSSANAAMAVYDKTPEGLPSTNLTQPHELDISANSLELKKTLRVLEGACEALCTTLAPPMHTLVNRVMCFEAPCLRIAVSYKVADALLDHPNGRHIQDVAQVTGLDSKKLTHVLRLLATRHCFREVSQDVFANNRLSLTLLSSDPFSSLLGTFCDECTQGVGALHDVIHDPEWGTKETETKSAFMYSVRNEMPDGSFFDYQRAHPEKYQRFSRGMVAWSTFTGSNSVTINFPWDQYKTFCDFGSGLGHLALALVNAQPHLKITLQDLPGPITAAKQLWSQKYGEGVTNGQVQFVPFDFLKEDPVPEQDVYYLKHIIHNWPDSVSIEILKRIVKVMPSHGRVLIHEFLTPSASPTSFNPSTIGLEKAPEPLLPNYGTGQIRAYAQDISMMSLFNAFEKNIDDFIALGKDSGLELVKAWDYGETVALEYKLM